MNVLKWMKSWVFWVVLVAVLVVVGGLVWWWQKSFTSALLVVGAIVAAILLWILIQWLVNILRARMMSKRLQSELENQPTYLPSDFKETTPGELKNKFRQSIQTLRQTLGKGFLYELPWFLLMGEAGSGKTTSLRKSNIRWPLGGEQQGIGGTVNCDWWFANEAVILDTAGRFAVHEKGSPVVPVWDNFLKMIKKVRPRKPIDGVVVAIPATSLIATEAERPRLLEEAKKKAKVLHDKLSEIQRKLQLVFPVYVLITKCDKIRGFEELCTLLSPEMQGSLVGWGNPGALDQPFNATVLDDIFAGVREDFLQLRTNILRDGETPENADRIYLFPEELGCLQPVLAVYLEKLLEFSRYEEPHRFRGVFFSSGGQDQQPMSSLLEIERKDEPAAKQQAPQPAAGAGTMMLQVADDLFGRPYFVHDFYVKKVFQESGLCRPSRKVKDWMAMVQRGSQVAAVVLAVFGLIFFVWAFFAKSSAYDAINDQLAAVNDSTEIPPPKDDLNRRFTNRQPFAEYQEIDKKNKEPFNRLSRTYAVVQEYEETIDGGPLEQIYLTLDRILWLGVAGALTESEGSYVRADIPTAGRFTDLPDEVQKLIEVRKKFLKLREEEAEVHEIIELLEKESETLPNDLRPVLQHFYRPGEDALLHKTTFGRDDDDLDEAIARLLVEEVFRAQDRSLVEATRSAYLERSKPENLLLEQEEDGSYVFATYGGLHEDAKAFGDSRQKLIKEQLAEGEELGQEVLTFAVALRGLEQELAKVNAAFKAGKKTAKEEAEKEDPEKKEGQPPTETGSYRLNRALRFLAKAARMADILGGIQKSLGKHPQGFVDFLIDDGLRTSDKDPSLGEAYKTFALMSAISEDFPGWEVGGETEVSEWTIKQAESDGLNANLKTGATKLLEDLQVVIETKEGGEQLALRVHSSTRTLLTALGQLAGKVATADAKLRMSPADADKSLSGNFDDAKYIENLALNGPACKKLYDEVLKEEIELYKLFGEIENLDRFRGQGEDRLDKETLDLNRRLVAGGKRLIVVHFWDGMERLPSLQGAGDAFSEDLGTLLAVTELASFAETLDAAGWKSPKKLFDRLKTDVRLAAETTLDDLREAYKPHRAYLPGAGDGFGSPLMKRGFFAGDPRSNFFQALYPEKRTRFESDWAAKLPKYVNEGRKAHRFIEIVDRGSQDEAFVEYSLVKAAFTDDLKLVQAQANDRKDISDHLKSFETVEVAPGSHGEALATLLKQLSTIEIEEPAEGTLPFFQRQRRALLERTRKEARLFLAHKIISDATAFLDGFKALCDGKFPFHADPFAPGVPPEKLFTFLDTAGLSFYAGKSTTKNSFRSLVSFCARELGVTASSGFHLELERLAQDLELSFDQFAPAAGEERAPRNFTVFFWPRREGVVAPGFGQKDLDLFFLDVPGDRDFELVGTSPTERNVLWALSDKNRATNQLLQQAQYTMTLYFGTNDQQQVRKIGFDREAIRNVAAVAPFFTIDMGNEVARRFPALGRRVFLTNQLQARSEDAWYLLRLIRLFDGSDKATPGKRSTPGKKWTEGNRNQEGRGLKFLLKGNVLTIPLRMTTKEGKTVPFEHELVVSFWKSDDRGRVEAVPAPDFHVLFDDFREILEKRWKLESLGN